MCPARLGSPSRKDVTGFPHMVQTDDFSLFVLSKFETLELTSKSFSIASSFVSKPLPYRDTRPDRYFPPTERENATPSASVLSSEPQRVAVTVATSHGVADHERRGQ